MAARLSELEDSNKLLTSCTAFGSGFMAAKIAICIMMRVFGLNKKKAIKDSWASVLPQSSLIAKTTSRAISRTFLCNSGVKYSLTRNTTAWKMTIML